MSAIYTIAEIGQAHDGSLGMAHAYVDALAKTGVNAVKFQVHLAEAESSIHETFRIPFSYQDETRMEYWKRISFNPTQWFELKKHCEALNLDFIASPFSNSAVDLLDKLDVQKFKVGSGEVNNHLMLRKIAETGKDIILSSGMSSFQELDDSVSYLMRWKSNVSILQCTSSYPTAPEEWGLNVMREFKERYCIPVGFSDHSGDIFACLAAAVCGAEILEFHVVFDNRMFGPDTSSSITIDQVHHLTTGLNLIDRAIKNPVDKSDASAFQSLKNIFGKSLAINKDLAEGHRLTIDDLESKKPANMGISAKNFSNVVGCTLKTDMKQWDFINEKNLL